MAWWSAKKTKKEELEDKIRTLEEIGELRAAGKYKAELAKIQVKEEKAIMAEEGTVFPIPVSEEEYETAGSKFAAAGLHTVEMQMPMWDTPGVSIAFPFVLIDENDPDEGKSNKVSSGVGANAVWKLKDILKALGVLVTMKVGKDGKKHPQFDANQVAGMKAKVLFEEMTGHKGGDPSQPIVKYTKPTTILPLEAEAESLGI